MSRRAVAVRRGLPPAPGVAAPADRRFRRSDARPTGRRPLAPVLVRWIAAAALIVLAAVAVRAAVHAVLTASIWTVRRVEVTGTARLSRGEVDSMLAGLTSEDLLTASLEPYRRRLLGSAWIAAATLRRRLPSTVQVDIVERVPMAVARAGNELYLVDRSGALIDEFGPQYHDLDLSIVDGLVPSGGRAASAADPERVQAVQHLLDALATAPDLRSRVSQVDVSNAHDLVVVLDTDPAALHLGETRFVERLRRYLELAPTLHEHLKDLDYVDLRFDDHVYVRPHVVSQDSRGSGRSPGGGRDAGHSVIGGVDRHGA